MNNPLETYKETYLTEIKQILIKLYNQRSEIYNKNIYGPLNYTFNVSYSVPNWDLICQIVKFLEKNCRQVIEIGSGTGLWAALISLLCKLKNHNIEFIATDYEVQRILYTEILRLHANNAIKKYKNSDCLFLCWPPSQDMKDVYKHQYSAGKMLQEFKGNYLIYIGLPKKEELEEIKKLEKVAVVFTGDDLFFEEIEKNWEIIDFKDLVYTISIISTMYKDYETEEISDEVDLEVSELVKDGIYFYKRRSTSRENSEDIRDSLLYCGLM